MDLRLKLQFLVSLAIKSDVDLIFRIIYLEIIRIDFQVIQFSSRGMPKILKKLKEGKKQISFWL